jgi:hypothetical protein
MKRLGMWLSFFFVFLVFRFLAGPIIPDHFCSLGCSEEEVDEQEHNLPVADFKGVLLKDEQGREVTLKIEYPVYYESNDSGVYIKINMTPMPNVVHVIDDKTNEEIRALTWRDGYPVIPYPKGSGLHKYKMIAIWNQPNEFHVHEAIAKFEIKKQ